MTREGSRCGIEVIATIDSRCDSAWIQYHRNYYRAGDRGRACCDRPSARSVVYRFDRSTGSRDRDRIAFFDGAARRDCERSAVVARHRSRCRDNLSACWCRSCADARGGRSSPCFSSGDAELDYLRADRDGIWCGEFESDCLTWARGGYDLRFEIGTRQALTVSEQRNRVKTRM